MFYFPTDSPSFLLHFFGLVLTGLVSLFAAWWLPGRTRDRAGTLMLYLLLSHAVMATLVIAQLVSPPPN